MLQRGAQRPGSPVQYLPSAPAPTGVEGVAIRYTLSPFTGSRRSQTRHGNAAGSIWRQFRRRHVGARPAMHQRAGINRLRTVLFGSTRSVLLHCLSVGFARMGVMLTTRTSHVRCSIHAKAQDSSAEQTPAVKFLLLCTRRSSHVRQATWQHAGRCAAYAMQLVEVVVCVVVAGKGGCGGGR